MHARALVALACLLAAPALAAVRVAVHDQAGPAADVVVALEPLEARPPAASGTATIDQVNKQFVPTISVVRVGTAIDFPNSDRIRHEVYSFSAAKIFTLKLYAGKAAPPVLFDHPGLVVLGCNIHDGMAAFVAVVDTPYFGLTGSDGVVALAAPPGRYRLRIWHPGLERPVPAESVVVRAEPEKTLDVAISRLDSPAAVAPWSD